MNQPSSLAGTNPMTGTCRLAVVILLVAPLVSLGCGRKTLPPTVGDPQDIMKNPDGTVGPMPGTPGYRPPKK